MFRILNFGKNIHSQLSVEIILSQGIILNAAIIGSFSIPDIAAETNAMSTSLFFIKISFINHLTKILIHSEKNE